MSRKKQVVSENYLDYVPQHSGRCEYETDEQGKVTILKKNEGLFHRVAQKFLGKPAVSYIHLDEMGNFIWPRLDGKRTIHEIAALVKEEFGNQAEPLYNRLVQYIRTLEEYGFIEVRNVRRASQSCISSYRRQELRR